MCCGVAGWTRGALRIEVVLSRLLLLWPRPAGRSRQQVQAGARVDRRRRLPQKLRSSRLAVCRGVGVWGRGRSRRFRRWSNCSARLLWQCGNLASGRVGALRVPRQLNAGVCRLAAELHLQVQEFACRTNHFPIHAIKFEEGTSANEKLSMQGRPQYLAGPSRRKGVEPHLTLRCV
jgi:hypothetical protein